MVQVDCSYFYFRKVNTNEVYLENDKFVVIANKAEANKKLSILGSGWIMEKCPFEIRPEQVDK